MIIENNPIDITLEAVSILYPDLKCRIQFNPELRGMEHGECGSCVFEDDGIYIDISTEIPFIAISEIIAHEIAHAVTGKNVEGDGHTKEWEAEFENILKKYIEIGNSRFGEPI